MEESDYDNEQYSTDITACAFDVECGGPDMIRNSMSIQLEKGGPDDYYMKVVLSYDGVDMESPTTNSTYRLNG